MVIVVAVAVAVLFVEVKYVLPVIIRVAKIIPDLDITIVSNSENFKKRAKIAVTTAFQGEIARALSYFNCIFIVLLACVF